MKTRQSFVSNSSSASVVVYWRSTIEDDRPVEEKLIDLFDVYGYKFDEKTKKIVKDTTYHNEGEKERADIAIEISKKTKNLKDNAHKTEFSTSMLNSYEDVDPFKHLISALYIREDEFRLIDVIVIRDS